MPPRLFKRTPGEARQFWAWLGMPGQTQPKVKVPRATFLWWISQCKKQRRNRYIISKNTDAQAILSDKSIMNQI